MRTAFAAAVFAVLLAAGPSLAGVGFQYLTIEDPGHAPLEVGIWYPTDASPTGPIPRVSDIPVAYGAPVKGDHLPLILMSHGHGGAFAGHADTAIALAEAGYVAVAVTHTGDNWRDTSAALAIWERPRHLKVLDAYMLEHWPDHALIDSNRVGAFGFSAGGFTVLAAAGGEPDLGALAGHCREHPDFYDCKLIAQAGGKPLPTDIVWVHDAHIRAVVTAAPALGFAFGRQGLAKVTQPVQLWRAEDDQILPHPYYAEAVRLNLPAQPEAHVVPKAGHYDFLQPCNAEFASNAPEICTSAPGFSRVAFHAEFNRAIVAFFDRTLKGAR